MDDGDAEELESQISGVVFGGVCVLLTPWVGDDVARERWRWSGERALSRHTSWKQSYFNTIIKINGSRFELQIEDVSSSVQDD